jgi:hypothetical protein
MEFLEKIHMNNSFDLIHEDVILVSRAGLDMVSILLFTN